jgi:hypothetical protein
MPSEFTVIAGGAGGDLLPPNAKAGQCYARVYTPPVYKTKHEQVLKRDESESVSIIPAKFETVEETVLVREASQTDRSHSRHLRVGGGTGPGEAGHDDAQGKPGYL